jgi:MFS family permease
MSSTETKGGFSFVMSGTTAKATSKATDIAARKAGKNQAFNRLMFGSSISMFGSRISTIAFPMLVLHLSGSPLVAGLVVCAAITPSMFVYIPAGALVDRWDPKPVMLVSEIGRGIAIASVVAPLAFGRRPSVYLLILAMVAEEILEIFSTLAEQRFFSLLIERDKASREQARRAQARIEARTHAAVLAGRPVGPYLFELKPILPFLADAASFVVSVLSIVCIKDQSKDRNKGRNAISNHPNARAKKTKGWLRKDICGGILWLFRNKYASITIELMASTTLISQALILIFLTEAHAQRLSSLAIGMGLAASGAGGVLGSIVAGRLGERVKSSWLQIQMCAWSAAFALLAISGGRSFLWIAAAMTVLGFTGSIGNIEFGSYLVQNVTNGMLARVASICQVLTIGACGLGSLLGGIAIQGWGARGAVSLLFMVTAALAIFSFRRPGQEAKLGDDYRVLAGKGSPYLYSKLGGTSACLLPG